MAKKRKLPGLGLICSEDGVIITVIHDGLRLTEASPPGSVFSSILNGESRHKASAFLNAMRTEGSVTDCSMKVAAGRRVLLLRFWGAFHDGFYHIVGARTSETAVQIRKRFHVLMTSGGSPPERGLCDSLQAVAHSGTVSNPELVMQPRGRACAHEAANGSRREARRYVALEEQLEERTRWLRTAAHDLLNPVGAVLACSEMLMTEEEQTFTSEQQCLIHSIHSSAESMILLLNDVAAISALGDKFSPSSLEPVEIEDLIQESISCNLAFAMRKQTKLEFRTSARVFAMPLDREQMLHVFNNLLENAIKYSQAGAKVEVRIAVQRRAVLISVKDNGPGIPPDEFKNLFTPFQKTRARTAAGAGTGLGLAICKRIIERHSGEIRAESSIGNGTTFYVSLPIARD